MRHIVLKGILFTSVLVSLQVFASGRIAAVQVHDGEVDIDIETTLGARYQPQCCSNLVEGGWTDLGSEFVAISNVTTCTFSQETSSCYLRVVKTADSGSAADIPPPPDDPPPPPNAP